MDSCDQENVSGTSHDDEFLTSLSADTPETSVNEILGSVFGDSSPSSLEILTPVDLMEDDCPESSLIPMTSKFGTANEPAIANPILPHIAPHGVNETDIFSTDTYMSLGDDMNTNHFVDFTTSATTIPPLEAMVPPSQLPDLGMIDGFDSPSTAAAWSDTDTQLPQAGQDERMTIIIDKARPETLTQVMNVLTDSRARVEFRRG